MEKRLKKIEEDLALFKEDSDNKHEAYKFTFENVSHMRHDISLLMEKFDDIKDAQKNAKEISDFLKNIKWGKGFLIGLIAFVGSIIALLIGVKELMK